MPRTRSIPDTEVLALARGLYAAKGEKAVSFGSVGQAAGLAPSTLAQRYRSVEGMLAAAAIAGWDALIEASAQADQAAADKGPQGYLKLIDASEAPLLLMLGNRDAQARARAADWRAAVEAALIRRLGQGDKARSGAQALFAAWQGQLLWDGSASGLKDIARRLS
ncbi:transcriptional regulator [Xinfangfangia pollutisoli]|uniref:transcriptional regulator n=1 Tax=Xinfangfangia pollutisoli TaxID=2865960 RepID=UPI001CD5B1A2|nr:transcriptional regulator [Xinfangfangia pollutisoli]